MLTKAEENALLLAHGVKQGEISESSDTEAIASLVEFGFLSCIANDELVSVVITEPGRYAAKRILSRRSAS